MAAEKYEIRFWPSLTQKSIIRRAEEGKSIPGTEGILSLESSVIYSKTSSASFSSSLPSLSSPSPPPFSPPNLLTSPSFEFFEQMPLKKMFLCRFSSGGRGSFRMVCASWSLITKNLSQADSLKKKKKNKNPNCRARGPAAENTFY